METSFEPIAPSPTVEWVWPIIPAAAERFTPLRNKPILVSLMRLIAAALSEELRIALDLCSVPRKISIAGLSLWQATFDKETFRFLKMGVGPVRAGKRVENLLSIFKPVSILVVGYAGGLDPALRVGDLIVGQKASMLADCEGSKPSLENLALGGCWDLAGSPRLATLIGREQATVHSGAFITSPYIIGDPAQKKILLRRFGAAAIDMETAAVARAAAAWGIPVSCVRAVSDEAGDDFLAPFSYDPTAGLAGRAVRIAAAGNWIRRCKQWRIRAERARSSLNRFLRCYLEWVGREYPSTTSP